MSSSNVTKLTILVSSLAITGCASVNTYSRVEAEPIHVTANFKGETPQGIVEDAMRVDGSAPLFDAATYSKIENAAKSAKDLTTAQRNIRDLVCNGSEPRVQPKLTVHLILNKPPKAQPLDVVAEKNRLLISLTKTYLKKVWLDEGSRVVLMGKTVNADYESYDRHMVQTQMERRSSSSRVSVIVPFLPASSAKEIEAYFANARGMPTLKPIEQASETEWFPSRSYLSVALPNHQFVLSNKVSDILLATWGFERYGTETQSSIHHRLQLTPETSLRYFGISDGAAYRGSAHYMPTGNSWKLKDGSTAYPLMKTVIDDLGFLKSSFAWRVPKADIKRLFHETENSDLQYWGYQFENGNYSAALALQHQAFMWSRLLENQTEINQSSNEDGSITYEVRPSFSAFCKWAVPTTSLTAE